MRWCSQRWEWHGQCSARRALQATAASSLWVAFLLFDRIYPLSNKQLLNILFGSLSKETFQLICETRYVHAKKGGLSTHRIEMLQPIDPVKKNESFDVAESYSHKKEA